MYDGNSDPDSPFETDEARDARTGIAEAAATEDTEGSDRPLGRAVRRGWQCRCPNCGAGPVLKGYLKLRDSCPVCGQELHHARADDGPAYLTILIVGHIMGPMLLWSFTAFRPDPLILASVFMVGSTALSLWMLPRLKGMIVGFQWAKRMHGFGAA